MLYQGKRNCEVKDYLNNLANNCNKWNRLIKEHDLSL